MEEPTLVNESSRKIAAWSTDITIADGETIQQVIARDSEAGAAMFTTAKALDKNWKVHLSIRIEETDK